MNARAMCILATLLLGGGLVHAEVPDQVNYQGRLLDGTNLFNGHATVVLRLYREPAGGEILCEDSNDVTVVDGLYTVVLGDVLNPAFFDLRKALGVDEAYLEIEVNGVILEPRERIQSVPYALMAGTVTNNSIKAAMIQGSAVTASKIANATVVRSLNGLRDDVFLAAGTNVTITGAAQQLTIAAAGDGVGVPCGGIVLAATCPNTALEAAGFVALATNTGGQTWTLVTNRAAWAGRTGHAALEYNGRMWVLGGLGAGSTVLNDVWHSTNGVDWVQATAAAPWAARYWFGAVAYDNKMWVMGGQGSGVSYLHDVWFSTNGVDWTQATNAAGWSIRNQPVALAHAGKMWILGGWYYGGMNDVWCTTNGATWTQVTASAPWSARNGHAGAVHRGKLWVLGGVAPSFTNDVWSSADGSNWMAATHAAGWSARDLHLSASYDDKLWVFSGWNGNFLNDVWTSPDGAAWTQATNAAAWSGRRIACQVVHGGRVWVLGGMVDADVYTNDVWATGQPDKLGRYYLYQRQ